MGNMSVDVKMLKDGKRTVIVIDGADAKSDEIAWALLQNYFGFLDDSSEQSGHAEQEMASSLTEANDSPQQEAPIPVPPFLMVQGLEPLPEESIKAPSQEELDGMEDYRLARQRNRYLISSGKYAGMTPIEALHKDNENALIEFFNMTRHMKKGSPEREEIISSCKQYLLNIGSRADLYPDRQSRVNFLLTFDKMGGLKAIINGFSSVADFCNYASDEEINIAFRQTLYALQERGRNG